MNTTASRSSKFIEQENPQQKNQLIQNKYQAHHSDHQHDELDSDCDGCQTEKRQNQKLVDFYHRLDKMSTKVKKFKQVINPENFKESNFNSDLQKNIIKNSFPPSIFQQKLRQLNQKLALPELPSVSQIKQYSSKQIGFELAAALIERQMKYKHQNKKLQQRINELLSQKKEQSNNYQILEKANSSIVKKDRELLHPEEPRIYSREQIFHDSLDDFQNQKYLGSPKRTKEDSFWDIDDDSTFKYQETTFFETKKKNISLNQNHFTSIKSNQQQESADKLNGESKKRAPYNTEEGYGLNLWLYEFRPEDYEQKLQGSLNSKNKLLGQQRYSKIKALQPKNEKNKLKMASVHKTSISGQNNSSKYNLALNSKKKILDSELKR